MALTKDDIQQIKDVIIEAVAPMFEYQTEYLGGRIDRLEARMGSIESGMDKSEKTFETFRYDARHSVSGT